jgi:hypothetical protein
MSVHFDNVNRTCRKHGRHEKSAKNFILKPAPGRDNVGDLGIDGKIMLK